MIREIEMELAREDAEYAEDLPLHGLDANETSFIKRFLSRA